MKTVSSVCRIVVISSSETAYCISFVPADPVLKEPLYVAFRSCCPGHYDSTDSVYMIAKT